MGSLQISRSKPASSQKAAVSPKPVSFGKESKIDFIIQAAEQFASSYGLKPYRVLIIKDAETKKKLQSTDWNQRTLSTPSQLIVFATDQVISKERIDSYIADIAGVKKVSAYSFLSYKKYLESHINHQDKEGKTWAAKQVSLAVSNLLGAAARVHVKATVVQEADWANLDDLLGLTEKKLSAGLAVILEETSGEAPKPSGHKVYRKQDLVEYI